MKLFSKGPLADTSLDTSLSKSCRLRWFCVFILYIREQRAFSERFDFHTWIGRLFPVTNRVRTTR